MKWARIKYLFQWLRAPYIRDFALQIWVSNFLFQNKRRSFLGFLAHIPHLQTYVVLASSIAFISNLPRLCVPRVHHLYTTMCTCLSLSLSLFEMLIHFNLHSSHMPSPWSLQFSLNLLILELFVECEIMQDCNFN